MQPADPQVAYLLGFRRAQQIRDSGDLLAAADEYEALKPLATRAAALAMCLANLASANMLAGRLSRAEELYLEAANALRTKGSRQGVDSASARIAILSWRREGLGAAAALPGQLPPGPMTDFLRVEVALEAGDFVAAREALPDEDHPQLGFPSDRAILIALRCRVFVATHDVSAAQSAFADWRDLHGSMAHSLMVLTSLCSIDDALSALADRSLLETIAAAVEPWTQWRYTARGIGTGADYFRGALALALDRVDGAERWFSIGHEWASRWGLDTITGRNLWGLAEVAERRGDHALAMRHLDAAGALFAGRGATLYLDQVIAKKSVLGA